MSELALPAIATRRARVAAVGGLRFDCLTVALGGWMIGGLYLDGWAHLHIAGLETFFTPWHAVLYSGYLTLALLLGGTVLVNRSRGYAWREAIPAGYNWSLLGAVLFALGGVADMTWHLVFGIEVSIEALLSPTHLLLALGGALLISGPIRAAWGRLATGRAALWPAMLALTILEALFIFFTDYAQPFLHRWATDPVGRFSRMGILEQEVGVTAVMFQAAVLMGLVLFAVRRWRGVLPVGSLALLIGLPLVGLMVIDSDGRESLPFMLVAGVAALTAEGLLLLLKPSAARLPALRLFAFLVPVILYGGYFLALQVAGGGIVWSIPLWAGTIALAGVAGWAVSYLVAPAAPHEV